jgi:hypothetical protein
VKETSYASCRVAFHDADRRDPIDGIISVAFIPDDLVKNVIRIGDTSPSVAVNLTNPVLQGFEIAFNKDDHHLKEFGIMVSPTSIDVICADNDYKDKFYWEADIVELG